MEEKNRIIFFLRIPKLQRGRKTISAFFTSLRREEGKQYVLWSEPALSTHGIGTRKKMSTRKLRQRLHQKWRKRRKGLKVFKVL